MTFAKPYSDWQGLFSPMYPAATDDSPSMFNNGWVNKIPVTGGPFKLDNLNPDPPLK